MRSRWEAQEGCDVLPVAVAVAVGLDDLVEGAVLVPYLLRLHLLVRWCCLVWGSAVVSVCWWVLREWWLNGGGMPSPRPRRRSRRGEFRVHLLCGACVLGLLWSASFILVRVVAWGKGVQVPLTGGISWVLQGDSGERLCLGGDVALTSPNCVWLSPVALGRVYQGALRFVGTRFLPGYGRHRGSPRRCQGRVCGLAVSECRVAAPVVDY